MRRIDLLKSTSIVLDKANKPPTFDSKMVDAMGKNMLDKWAKLALPLVKSVKNIAHTKDAVNKFIKKVDKTMAKFPKLVEKDNKEYTTYLYKYSKEQFIKAEKITKANIPTIDASIWTVKDEATIEALNGMTGESVSGFYGKSVQTAVAESVKKNVFERKLVGDTVGEALKADLAKALKLKGGALESAVVPKGFHGTAQQYFNGLSQHTATLARTSSNVYTLDYVEAKYLVVHSVRSSRTCLACLEIDGKKYKVSEAVSHVDSIMNAGSIDDLKDIQPWFHEKLPSEYKADELKDAKKQIKSQINSGVNLPPFHWKCACFVTSE